MLLRFCVTGYQQCGSDQYCRPHIAAHDFPPSFDDGVVAKHLLILFEAKAPQPDHDVHRDALTQVAAHHGPCLKGCLLGYETTEAVKNMLRKRVMISRVA